MSSRATSIRNGESMARVRKKNNRSDDQRVALRRKRRQNCDANGRRMAKRR